MKVCGLSWRRLVQCLLTGLLTAGVLYCFLYFHFSRHPRSYPASRLDLQASTSLPVSLHAVTWSGAGDYVTEVAASEGMQHLREFHGAARHYWRKLQDLLVARNPAKFPSVSYWNCSCLWASDADNHTGNTTLLMTNMTRMKTLQDYLAETQNCSRFVLHGGFKMATVSEEELAFPLAFSLLVYKDLDQVVRLLRAVYRPHNVYCVHADQKSADTFHSSLRHVISCLPNVMLLDTAVDVQWGRYSVLKPEILCLRMLWQHATKWRYFINLTGQEFPLKTNKELVQILTAFRGANDIRGTQHPRFSGRWKKKLPAPYNLTVSKGAVHIVASRAFADYALHSRVARDLLTWAAQVRFPEEIFFSTLNHNPHLGVPGSYTGDIADPFKETFHRFKLWNTTGFPHVQPCAGRWVRGICHFGVHDVTRMTRSPRLFANKFSYDLQPLAYDCLEEWYWHKVQLEDSGHPSPLNVSLYEESNIVKFRYQGPVLIWQ